MLDSMSSDGSDCEIKKVDCMTESESDSDDCVIEQDDSKVKSTGFFHKLRLKNLVRSKGGAKKGMDEFREGESEEYNSEVDGEIEIEAESGMNFDILGVREGDHRAHKAVVDSIFHFEDLPEDY